MRNEERKKAFIVLEDWQSGKRYHLALRPIELAVIVKATGLRMDAQEKYSMYSEDKLKKILAVLDRI